MGARTVLACGGAAMGLALAWACSRSPGFAPAGDGGADAGATGDASDWDRVVTRPADDAATAGRAACTYGRGALPAETLGPSVPLDEDIPIENIVVLMQENRSFDSYFGHLDQYTGRNDIESAPDDAANPEIVGAANPTLHPFVHAPAPLHARHEPRVGRHPPRVRRRQDGRLLPGEHGLGRSARRRGALR